MFVVIKFEFLACNKRESRANGVFIFGDKIIDQLPNGRKTDVRGAWRVYVLSVPLLKVDKHLVVESFVSLVTFGSQFNVFDHSKLLGAEVR